MPQHKQVRVRCPSGERVSVDEGMRDFLRAIWKLGIETYWLSGIPSFPMTKADQGLQGVAWTRNHSWTAVPASRTRPT
jgi:hypothetical protein